MFPLENLLVGTYLIAAILGALMFAFVIGATLEILILCPFTGLLGKVIFAYAMVASSELSMIRVLMDELAVKLPPPVGNTTT